MSEPVDLLPCPFCGGANTFFVDNGRMWRGTKGWSEPTSVSIRHWCEKEDGQPSRMLERVGRDRESAITAWNRRSAAALESLRADAELRHAINKAAAELPEGWEIHIEVERGAGTVALYDPDGFRMVQDVDADDRLTAEVRAAIDAARRGG